MQSIARTTHRSKQTARLIPLTSIEGLQNSFMLDLQKFLIEKNIMGGQNTAGHGETVEFSVRHGRFHRTQPPLLERMHRTAKTYRNRLLKRVNNPMLRS